MCLQDSQSDFINLGKLLPNRRNPLLEMLPDIFFVVHLQFPLIESNGDRPLFRAWLMPREMLVLRHNSARERVGAPGGAIKPISSEGREAATRTACFRSFRTAGGGSDRADSSRRLNGQRSPKTKTRWDNLKNIH